MCTLLCLFSNISPIQSFPSGFSPAPFIAPKTYLHLLCYWYMRLAEGLSGNSNFKMTWLATVWWIPNSWISKLIFISNYGYDTIYIIDLLLSVDVDISQGCKTTLVVVLCSTIPFSWECDQSNHTGSSWDTDQCIHPSFPNKEMSFIMPLRHKRHVIRFLFIISSFVSNMLRNLKVGAITWKTLSATRPLVSSI